ncbi:MAG: histidinol-phosphate transaminase [Propionibacteriaceae bacterium]|nr:histidinol-phosphate transaminase [Propionibacteriaceae bacterium]
MAVRVRADLATIPTYKPGRSPAQGAATWFKLSSNESPYPPLPSVSEAITLQASMVHRYPDAAVEELTRATAARLQVPSDRIVFGAGSVESISQVIRTVAGAGDEVIYAWRSFEAYPILTRGAGATPVEVPLTADHRHDLPAMLAAITPATRLIIVCTPNNPTGTAVNPQELAEFVAQVPPEIAILIDEAYYQFSDHPDAAVGLAIGREHENVIVAHTFSKAYGLAGLRIGYALAPQNVAEAMRKVALPFGVTNLAQAAARASYDADAELTQRVRYIVAERERVASALAADGWRLPRSEANFLWLPLGEATDLGARTFEEHGLIVRAFPGEGIRVTIAEDEANDRIIEAASRLKGQGG